MEYETIFIIIIVAALLWWLFFGGNSSKSTQIVNTVTNVISAPVTESNSGSESVAPSVVFSTEPSIAASTEQLPAPVPVNSSVGAPIIVAATANTPAPVVVATNGNNLASQNATIDNSSDNNSVLHTATGEIVNITTVAPTSTVASVPAVTTVASAEPLPNDSSKVSHAVVVPDNKGKHKQNKKYLDIEKKIKKTLSDSSEESHDLISSIPVPANSFGAHASADHSVANSDKKKKHKK